jgi:Tfp pilus assembly protein PilO
VSLTDRDRKLLLAFVPIVVIAAYWFLLLAPKRDEAAKAGEELTKQEQRLDAARVAARSATTAKDNFSTAYAQVVRIGKAIPAELDMPGLIVQLDHAAAGTGISFTKIATGDRQTAASTPAPAPSTGSQSSSSSPPVAAGGAQAQSAPGGAVESANNASQTSDKANAAAQQSGVSPSDTQTSTSSSSGLPVGGGAAAGSGASGGAAAASQPNLETVPLELEFVGNFFNLADFFHRVKRFVRVANQDVVVVGGRLIAVQGVRWASDPEIFPRIRATLSATIYLSPKAEGATAGATPAGPATTPAGTSTSGGGSTPAAAPTATATP